jgi:hypothetical protein
MDSLETMPTAILDKPEIAFTKPEILRTFCGKLSARLSSLVLDADTPQGRKEITSIAYSVAITKTKIDAIGKEYVSHIKEQAKITDNIRRETKDALIALQEKIKEPLDRWNQAEENRVNSIKAKISDINQQGNLQSDEWGTKKNSTELTDSLEALLAIQVTEDQYQEFIDEATELRSTLIDRIKEEIVIVAKREAEQAELEELRKAKAEQERKEQIRIEAEKLAEQRILAEKQKAEAEIQREKEKNGRAQKEQQELAEKQERERIEKIRIEEMRTKDEAHRLAIHEQIKSDLTWIFPGLQEHELDEFINQIDNGEIRNLTIKY